MKEYIAETGGRYTYSDDILNLQDLALSMTAIFSDCSPFIISGCTYTDGGITSGYLWLGGKVRYFEGVTNVALPYYIYESNSTETVVYANEANKRGRSCFLCRGSATMPEIADELSGLAPAFVEITESYAPRLIDKFFGRYALLLDTPAKSQTVKKDISFSGNISSASNITTSKELVAKGANTESVKTKVSDNGDGTISLYLNKLMACEIVLCSDGSFSFMSGEDELAKLDDSGFTCDTIKANNLYISSLSIYKSHITNRSEDSDTGSVSINYTGYNKGATKFRNFYVYDGKQCSIPIFSIEGKTRTARVDGKFIVSSTSPLQILRNRGYTKDNIALTAMTIWQDSDSETIAEVGFISNTTHDFSLKNYLGNIVITPKGYVDIAGDFKLKGIDIYSIFTTSKIYNAGLATKVDKIEGKQLSTEDFTTELLQKLNAIAGGVIDTGGEGYVTADDVVKALRAKLSASENLSDLASIATARKNLSVYSKGESDGRYLKISSKLEELVSLTADEVNNLGDEEAAALKASRQEAVRNVIKAEKQGIIELKMDKSQNLADLADKAKARKNISVYSVTEIDNLLEGKLGSDSAYEGVVFTETLKEKLDGITKGNFAYTNSEGVSIVAKNGYALIFDINKELAKYAPRLMGGYNTSEKASIASNLDIYTKTEANNKFARVEKLFQDYIDHLTAKGMTTAEAQSELRGKLDVLSSTEVSDSYLSKNEGLSDLALKDEVAKRAVCSHIGAGYKDDCHPRMKDSGWQTLSNKGSGTDASRLYIRQIGDIVTIQGVVNTSRKEGSNWGGVVAVIPNEIDPPKFALSCTHSEINSKKWDNRGARFEIAAGDRNILIFEQDWPNININLNFTYFI